MASTSAACCCGGACVKPQFIDYEITFGGPFCDVRDYACPSQGVSGKSQKFTGPLGFAGRLSSLDDVNCRNTVQAFTGTRDVWEFNETCSGPRNGDFEQGQIDILIRYGGGGVSVEFTTLVGGFWGWAPYHPLPGASTTLQMFMVNGVDLPARLCNQAIASAKITFGPALVPQPPPPWCQCSGFACFGASPPPPILAITISGAGLCSGDSWNTGCPRTAFGTWLAYRNNIYMPDCVWQSYNSFGTMRNDACVPPRTLPLGQFHVGFRHHGTGAGTVTLLDCLRGPTLRSFIPVSGTGYTMSGTATNPGGEFCGLWGASVAPFTGKLPAGGPIAIPAGVFP